MSRGGAGRDRRKLEEAARKLFDAAEGNPRRLATVAAQFQQAAAKKAGGMIGVLGGVSFQTGRPYVQMDWGESVGQLEVESARAHAMLILEAAQNAVNDAALLEWCRNELDLDRERAAQMIDALRTYRTDRWGQPDLELEFQKPPPEEES